MGYYDTKVMRGGKEYSYNSVTKKYKGIKEDADTLDGDVSQEEKELMEYFFFRKFFDHNLMSIMLIPSFACNLSCPYCFEKDYEPRKHKLNYFETVYKMIERYINMYPQGIHINFFGGEPLLWKEEIFSMLHKVIESYPEKISTSYVTNGTLIELDDIEKIKMFNCKYIQITLDGSKKEHDKTRCTKAGEETFDSLINIIIKLAKELKKETNINIRINLKDCEILELEKDIANIPKGLRKRIFIMPRVIFNTEKYSENNKNSYSNIEEYYEMFSRLGFGIVKMKNRKIPCEAWGDLNSFYILPDLSIWKCVNDINIEEACIGNIIEDGTIKYNYKNIAKWFAQSNPYADSKCVDCKKLPECGGGCVLFRIKNGERQCREDGLLSMSDFYG